MADYGILLRDHVTLTCRSVDDLLAGLRAEVAVGGVGVPVPGLAAGYEIVSSAVFGKIGETYVTEIHRWAKAHGVPVRRFVKVRTRR